jgi:hypothetical protein
MFYDPSNKSHADSVTVRPTQSTALTLAARMPRAAIPGRIRHRFIALGAAALLAAIPGFSLPASAEGVPPLSGVLGKVASVDTSSISVQTKAGLVHIEIRQPLTTYHQVPSDLNHVSDNSYIGVASAEQPDGVEVAKQIFIFPPELRGAAEGSVLMNPASGAATRSRMTNGSVSRPVAAEPRSRMTNGVVLKGDRTTLIVHYQDGAQTISVPANVVVTEVVSGKVPLATGDAVYAVTTKQPNGALATSKIFVVSAPSK